MENVKKKKNIDKGYNFIEITGNIGNKLMLKKFISENGIFHIVIGEEVTDLNFLLELIDYVKILISLKSPKCDFSLVGEMINLEHLYLSTINSSSLNLSKLIKIKYLFIKFNKKLVGFDSLLNLKHLELKSYPYSDLSYIELPNNLEKLEIISSKIETVDISKLPKKIKNIGIFLCSNLKKIKFNGGSQITNVVIENCKELVFLENIHDLIQLEYLIIENCPSIFSLDELKHLNFLKHVALCGSTNVSSGNLDFLKSIDHFYWNRLHF